MISRKETLKALIIEALRNAEANGENFDGWLFRDIANDMISYDSTIGDMVDNEDEIGDYAYSNLVFEIVEILKGIRNATDA